MSDLRQSTVCSLMHYADVNWRGKICESFLTIVVEIRRKAVTVEADRETRRFIIVIAVHTGEFASSPIRAIRRHGVRCAPGSQRAGIYPFLSHLRGRHESIPSASRVYPHRAAGR